MGSSDGCPGDLFPGALYCQLEASAHYGYSGGITLIAAIQIRNFKGIENSRRLNLSSFHVLVGPNGSGKSTFLEALDFVRACLADGPRAAVESRVPDFRDLTFQRKGGRIEVLLQLRVEGAAESTAGNLTYSLKIEAHPEAGVRVADELLQFREPAGAGRPARDARILGKTRTGNDFYSREVGRHTDSFDFGRTKLALAQTPPDPKRYATANAVKGFLLDGVRYLQLNSVAMRRPVPATRPSELMLDGTNLARVVGGLLRNGAAQAGGLETVRRWTEHLRYAMEDLAEIEWRTRPEDNAEYLVLKFAGGLECPSWLLSDGTLRMLAPTLPAFLPGGPRVYMVEEPENGVHPQALEIILKALAAIPSAQVFVATHSPLVVQQAGVEPLLCFRRSGQGGVQILSGARHPALKEWNGVPDLATIFASRVLG